jgi:3',5'-cyclic AMP phosphodiesterase CpdA
MKIAHISDLHIDINRESKKNYNKSKALLELLIREGFDHLIITGDIVENADKQSFQLVRNLLNSYGLLDSEKTTVIPGNHDIYGGVYLAEDVPNFPKRCMKTNYNAKVEEFSEYFKETFNNCYYPLKNKLFPFVKELKDVILIGLNSVAQYSLFNNPFASNGKISKDQINCLKKIFKSSYYKKTKKIILTHHHFYKQPIDCTYTSNFWRKIEKQTMKLKNKKSLIKLFTKYKTDAVLHGHMHETFFYFRKEQLFMNAGGSVLNKNENTFEVNYINVNADSLRYNICTFSNLKENTIQKSAYIKTQSKTGIPVPAEFSLN